MTGSGSAADGGANAAPAAARIEAFVGERELRDGVRRDEHRCAVALALGRAGCSNVSVGGGYAAFRFAGRPRLQPLPSAVNRFVEAFDARERGLAPFRFVLEAA